MGAVLIVWGLLGVVGFGVIALADPPKGEENEYSDLMGVGARTFLKAHLVILALGVVVLFIQ